MHLFYHNYQILSILYILLKELHYLIKTALSNLEGKKVSGKVEIVPGSCAFIVI
jgi:hypothetical protein